MATLPKATTSVSDTAGAVAGGTDICCVLNPCATSADSVPRLFGTAAAIYGQHGYSDGLEYAAYHISKTGKPVLVVGLPIATSGVVGRVDKTGNSGTSVASVTAGGSGVLGEHDGVVKTDVGGTIGTSQIKLLVSADCGRTFKRVRLGTATSYAIPYLGVTLSFAAGTLVAGDTIITWHGSSPRSDATGWAAARAALASQMKFFRSAILAGGDLQNSTEANALLAQADAYETSNERFVYFRASVRDRLPAAAMSHDVVRMTGAPALTFAEVGATGDTITRATGSWLADGFAVGDVITVSGSASNNVTGPIASLSATVITLGTTDLAAEVTSVASVLAYPGLTFAEVGATADTIVRSRGSWISDGFRVGDLVVVTGTASNNVTTDALAAVTALTLTLGTTDLAAEVVSAAAVSITAGQTKAAWMADLDSAFSTVNGFRIDMSAGRARFTSPFSAWAFRRPASWFASAREYSPDLDLHIAPWRKQDGPLPADLNDDDGNTLIEWDDRVDGSAGSAARFTTLRTWANGPTGGFVTLSLTRGDEGSLLSQSQNVAVVNLVCATVQLNTENAAIGVSLILNDDGTATGDSLSVIQKQVNDALELAVLQNVKGKGPRASKCVWTPSPDDVYNVAEPTMIGVTELILNGTVHRVNTVVKIRSAGQ